jgi:ribosomal protein S18 acetylase RimI-like enzyme
MSQPNITIRFDPPAEFYEPVKKGLWDHTESHVGSITRKTVAMLSHDTEGQVIGGIVGWMHMGWLYVDMLWVEEAHRRKGLGTKLLRCAEGVALEHGIRRVHLVTSTWQALDFYKKNDYRVFAELDITLDNAPAQKEHINYFLRKDL